MRLITSPTSDPLLAKAKAQKEEVNECNVNLWDPSTGPQEPADGCDN